MNDLNAFSRGIEAAAQRKEQERQEFNKRLGEPQHFIPNEDDDYGGGVGFWKANGGVVSYRKYANGYDPYSRSEYSSEFISILNKVAGNGTQT